MRSCKVWSAEQITIHADEDGLRKWTVKPRLTGMFFAAFSYVSRPHKLIFKLLMDEEMNLLVAKILLTNKVKFLVYTTA